MKFIKVKSYDKINVYDKNRVCDYIINIDKIVKIDPKYNIIYLIGGAPIKTDTEDMQILLNELIESGELKC